MLPPLTGSLSEAVGGVLSAVVVIVKASAADTLTLPLES